jgi:sterol desaturase/sphingolipid hydroxylase (fatty acid hydroxylase superfamily)
MQQEVDQMEQWLSQANRVAVLFAACVLLASLEALAPLFHYRKGRLRRSVPNLMLALGVVGVNVILTSVTATLASVVTGSGFGLFHSIARLHPFLFAAVGVAGLDFLGYIAHLLLHKLPWGWSLHRVHHSEREVDVTTAFRQHPGETLWRQGWLWLGIVAFGLPLWVVAAYLSLSSLNALFEHANLNLPGLIDRWLRAAMVTPRMHKIHHSRDNRETDSNYSNIFSVWDRIFGTYVREADFQRLRYGLDGFDTERKQTLRALLIEPFSRS